jgi:integrase
VTVKAVWHIVKKSARSIGVARLRRTIYAGTSARLCYASGGELEQIQSPLGHVSVQTTERYLAASSGFDQPSMIELASSRILELGARLRN